MANHISQMQEDQAWLASQNLMNYAGQWIAVFRQRIIAKGKNLKAVVSKVKKERIDEQTPLYIRVPIGLISV